LSFGLGWNFGLFVRSILKAEINLNIYIKNPVKAGPLAVGLTTMISMFAPSIA